VGIFPKRQKLNWSEITPEKAGNTPQKAKINLEWDYSPKGKTLNWSGITPQKAKIKLEWDYSPKDKI
jgi:hypothetical protein